MPTQPWKTYRNSAFVLAAGFAAGSLGLTGPNAASAQDAGARDLPAIVVTDPAKKPKRRLDR